MDCRYSYVYVLYFFVLHNLIFGFSCIALELTHFSHILSATKEKKRNNKPTNQQNKQIRENKITLFELVCWHSSRHEHASVQLTKNLQLFYIFNMFPFVFQYITSKCFTLSAFHRLPCSLSFTFSLYR